MLIGKNAHVFNIKFFIHEQGISPNLFMSFNFCQMTLQSLHIFWLIYFWLPVFAKDLIHRKQNKFSWASWEKNKIFWKSTR